MKLIFPKKHTLHALFVLDLLVFPLVNIGIGLRLSYLVILLFGFISILHILCQRIIVKHFFTYLSIFILSLVSSIVFYSSSEFTLDSLFVIISFFFALSCFSIATCFPSRIDKYILPVFLVVCSINFVFAFLTPFLPDFILSTYYNSSSLSGSSFFSDGITSIRSWYRPLGPQGSPTYSALSITLVYAFLVYFVKNNLVMIRSYCLRFFCVLAPIFITLRYSSRTEFVACLLLSFILIQFYFSKFLASVVVGYNFKVILLTSIPILISLSYYIYLFLVDLASQQFESFAGFNFDRFLLLLVNPLANTSDGDLRFTGHFTDFFSRFQVSPLFGSGIFNISSLPSIRFYHNDFFFFTAISGLLGLFLYLLFLRQISKLSYLLIIPLVFSGLTNSFFFCFPVVGAYFFLLSQTINLNRHNLLLISLSRSTSSSS